MLPKKINFKHKYSKFTKYWSPRIISEMNNYQFKLAKPFSENECKILVIEPRGVINTGDEGGDLTINEETWI